eukprot:jgi/Tetstr1/425750/TSEL_016169.t1
MFPHLSVYAAPHAEKMARMEKRRPAGIKPTRRFLRNTRWRGERMLLPYLDDFLFLADSREAACALRTTRIDALLIDNLGKIRNPKKIHREQPNTQADKHLGLEMDLRWHEFRAPAEKLATLARMASSWPRPRHLQPPLFLNCDPPDALWSISPLEQGLESWTATATLTGWVHSLRKGTASAANSLAAPLPTIKHMGGWSKNT